MKSFYIKEIDYVCSPSDLYIRMVHDPSHGKVQVNFHNFNSRNFFVSQTMRITDKKEDFDVLLRVILISLFEMYDRAGFQENILNGEIQGLFFYDNLEWVKSKSGSLIWKRG